METNHIGSCFFGFNQQKKWEYKTHLKEAMGESVQKMGKHGRLKWENDDNHWIWGTVLSDSQTHVTRYPLAI